MSHLADVPCSAHALGCGRALLGLLRRAMGLVPVGLVVLRLAGVSPVGRLAGAWLTGIRLAVRTIPSSGTSPPLEPCCSAGVAAARRSGRLPGSAIPTNALALAHALIRGPLQTFRAAALPVGIR